MDLIDLPLIPMTATLRAAVSAMKTRSRAGVVAREEHLDEERAWLFTAADVFRGLAGHKTALADLQRKRWVLVLEDHAASSEGLDVVAPQNTWSRYERFLDRVGASYTLLRRPGIPRAADMVAIVTRHEGLAKELSGGPKDCYCLGTLAHSFPPPSVSSGDACPYCRATVHCE